MSCHSWKQSNLYQVPLLPVTEKTANERLSVAECRGLLGASELSDAEVLELRDSLYIWLERFLDSHFDN